ncbi:MAG TPA: cysteine desulfurase family protein [Candidatus Angelobacter sp.]|nr:cysteine desulfurase family protein [Candidatus Angelobacter sp.]
MNGVRRVYLDNASTTPIDPKVLRSMSSYLKEKYGNSSSLHYEGRIAKHAIEESRDKIAQIIGAKQNEIIFTSGGTESDNLAILGLAEAYKHKGNHIITSSIEHKAILNSCKKLEKDGFEVTYLDVNKNGLVSLEHLDSSLRQDTILVSIMHANNEIGVIQPINKISKIIKESKIANPIFHSDACQTAGVLSVDIKELGVDALTISSSKIYGPKGVGCLYLSKNLKIEPIIVGGGQERGIRSGTENVASIIGFAEALTISSKKRLAESERLTRLRDYFLSKIIKEINGVSLNGIAKNRLPNNINISIRGVEGESLVLLLDERGISCSTGSACSSMDLSPSHVLISIGIPLEHAHCSVRFTLGRYTQKKDIDYAVDILSESVKKIRSMSSIK